MMSVDDKLEKNIRVELDRAADDIDAATLSRIRQIRARAIERTDAGVTNWFGVVSGALATTCVMLFAVMIMLNNEPVVTPLPAEDLEMISSLDELDLYQDLEFYQWLETYES